MSHCCCQDNWTDAKTETMQVGDTTTERHSWQPCVRHVQSTHVAYVGLLCMRLRITQHCSRFNCTQCSTERVKQLKISCFFYLKTLKRAYSFRGHVITPVFNTDLPKVSTFKSPKSNILAQKCGRSVHIHKKLCDLERCEINVSKSSKTTHAASYRARMSAAAAATVSRRRVMQTLDTDVCRPLPDQPSHTRPASHSLTDACLQLDDQPPS